MIGKWYKDKKLGLKLSQLPRIVGGIVQVIAIDNKAHPSENIIVQDYLTGDTYYFNEHIMNHFYKEISEVEIILYA